MEMEKNSLCSRKKMKPMKSSESEEDRISDLPEPILHHILSFLRTKNVIQTSLVSKRWRYLWMSIPHLNFDYFLWKSTQKIKQNQTGELRKRIVYVDSFMDFVDRVLLLREDSNIRTFRLSSGCGSLARRIELWMIAAVRQHVEEVHLEIFEGLGTSIEVPSILFTSAIRVFKLQCRHRFNVQFPNSMSSAIHLKTLELVSVQLPKGDSNGEFFLSCPVLENLIMRDCDMLYIKDLNISAFRLQKLVLESFSWYCNINICTPNLTSFRIKGSIREDCYLENLSSMVSAHIEVQANCLIKVLKGLYNAKTLTLSNRCYETSTKSPDRLEWLPKPFHNLRHLRLNNWYYSSWIHAVMNLLESSPYLETLVLEITKEEFLSANNGRDLGAHLTSHCMFDHLKSVEIHNLKGCENELKFLEFVLKNAVVLKNFTITTSKALSRDHHKAMEDFSKKLQLIPSASSNVTYYFS